MKPAEKQEFEYYKRTLNDALEKLNVLEKKNQIMRDALFLVAEAPNSGASAQECANDALEAIRSVDKL